METKTELKFWQMWVGLAAVFFILFCWLHLFTWSMEHVFHRPIEWGVMRQPIAGAEDRPSANGVLAAIGAITLALGIVTTLKPRRRL